MSFTAGERALRGRSERGREVCVGVWVWVRGNVDSVTPAGNREGGRERGWGQLLTVLEGIQGSACGVVNVLKSVSSVRLHTLTGHRDTEVGELLALFLCLHVIKGH